MSKWLTVVVLVLLVLTGAMGLRNIVVANASTLSSSYSSSPAIWGNGPGPIPPLPPGGGHLRQMVPGRFRRCHPVVGISRRMVLVPFRRYPLVVDT